MHIHTRYPFSLCLFYFCSVIFSFYLSTPFDTSYFTNSTIFAINSPKSSHPHPSLFPTQKSPFGKYYFYFRGKMPHRYEQTQLRKIDIQRPTTSWKLDPAIEETMKLLGIYSNRSLHIQHMRRQNQKRQQKQRKNNRTNLPIITTANVQSLNGKSYDLYQYLNDSRK